MCFKETFGTEVRNDHLTLNYFFSFFRTKFGASELIAANVNEVIKKGENKKECVRPRVKFYIAVYNKH